jgi:tRNA-(ms[2]io[6]A)-hydroxylase
MRNCEKKAASTALGLMYRHTDHFELLNKMSPPGAGGIAAFEQVIAIMKKRGIAYEHVTASRYASSLHMHVHKRDPES